MLFADPWHLLTPEGTLPPEHPRLWPKLMRMAEAIAAGWDLPARSARPTLLLCTRRPDRKPCSGQLWVQRLVDDRLLLYCPTCQAEEMALQNWQSTPWAGPRPEPTRLEPDPAEVDFEELLLALTENLEDWQSFLDLQTGRIINIPTECFRQLEGEEPSLFADLGLVESSALDARRIYNDESGRFVEIEPLDHRTSFSIMQSFVAGLPPGRTRQQLTRALEGKKPFRRFKDALEHDLAMRNAWFAYHDAALRDHAMRWLEDVRAEHGLD